MMSNNMHPLDERNYYIIELISRDLLNQINKKNNKLYFIICTIEGIIEMQSSNRIRLFLKEINKLMIRKPKRILLAFFQGTTPYREEFKLYITRNRVTGKFLITKTSVNQKEVLIHSIEEYKKFLQLLIHNNQNT